MSQALGPEIEAKGRLESLSPRTIGRQMRTGLNDAACRGVLWGCFSPGAAAIGFGALARVQWQVRRRGAWRALW